jgi:hypothetical protein
MEKTVTISLPNDIRTLFQDKAIVCTGPNNSIYLYTPENYVEIDKKIDKNIKEHNLNYPNFKRFIQAGVIECDIKEDQITIPYFIHKNLGSGNGLCFKIEKSWVSIRRPSNTCLCDDPKCAKCLSSNCKNPECNIHSSSHNKLTWKKS